MSILMKKRPSSFFIGVGLAVAGSAVVAGTLQAAVQQTPAPQQAATPAARCKISGKVTSGTTPLPGAAVLIKVADKLRFATSTDQDGKYSFTFTPSGASTFQISADLSQFAVAQKDVPVAAAPPCDATADFDLTLRPRTEPVAAPAPPPAPSATTAPAGAAQAGAGQTGQTPPTTPPTGQTTPPVAGATAPPTTPTTTAAAGRQGGAAGAPAGAAAAGATAQRFQALSVTVDANGQATLDATPVGDAGRLLPQGFSQDNQSQVVAINGTTDAIGINMSALNDRNNAIGQGQFDPATGQFAAGFQPAGLNGPAGGAGDNPFGSPAAGDQSGGAAGGRGGGGGAGGRGGGGTGGGFQIGGRSARGQSPYSGSTNYTYSGSALNSPIPNINGTVTQQPANSRNSYGGTFGGPLKVPGLYDDTNRRTNFQLNYSGSHNTSLTSQTVTVPTMAERAGDFSAALAQGVQLYDPSTGLPFANNQIPLARMNAASLQLMNNYYPVPTVANSSINNYLFQGVSPSASNSISLRITQNLSPTLATRGGGRGGAGGAGGGGRGGGGGGAPAPGGRGRGPVRWNIMLNTQIQYRESNSTSISLDPGLGGGSKSTATTVPVSITASHGRANHTISVNVTQSVSSTTNHFENTNNVAGNLGFQGISTNPLDYGVPSLSFSGFSGLRDSSPSQRTDRRVTMSYTLSRPSGKHQLRYGTTFTTDLSDVQQNSNARGTYTFTGLYTTVGGTAKGSGADFADFLLGYPQKVSGQFCSGSATLCDVKLQDRTFSAYVEDNWQKSGKLTLSLGLRYDLNMPYTEVNGRMANLDVAPGFTAVSPVSPDSGLGLTLNGPYTGAFPTALINADKKLVSPHVGFAYGVNRTTVARGSYSIQYNTPSYASIARSLTQQPPFNDTVSNIFTLATPTPMTSALTTVQDTTQNSYAVDKNYTPGMIQTWNMTVQKSMFRNWAFVAGYTGVKGTNLDLLRAPNRTATGYLIAGVAPFNYETDGAHSILQQGFFTLTRRLASGFSAGMTYVLEKSMDNASSLGSGGGVVAQNDQNLAAEWALSTLNRTHAVSGNYMWEIPFGPNHRWLDNGGVLAAVVGGWSMNGTISWSTGAPITIRCTNCSSDVLGGSNTTLRADLVPGQPLKVANPGYVTLPSGQVAIQFLNPAAFAIPAAGTYGNSPRNVVNGPNSQSVNMTFSRDVRISAATNKSVSLRLNVNNLFNHPNWGRIDNNINSPTFGMVTSLSGSRTMTVNATFRF